MSIEIKDIPGIEKIVEDMVLHYLTIEISRTKYKTNCRDIKLLWKGKEISCDTIDID